MGKDTKSCTEDPQQPRILGEDPEHQSTHPTVEQDRQACCERTLANIQKALGASNAGADDDDFAMVVSDLSVDLTNLVTAKIFDIPVRGSFCMHRECFDLNTWPMTATSNPNALTNPAWSIIAGLWRS